jgi:hypothetical protein
MSFWFGRDTLAIAVFYREKLNKSIVLTDPISEEVMVRPFPPLSDTNVTGDRV